MRPERRPRPGRIAFGAMVRGMSMPLKPCGFTGCRTLVPVGTSHCQRHAGVERLDRNRKADERRADRPSRRWYKLAAWKGPNGRRALQLKREPLCALCPEWSKQPAKVADHVVPHRDNYVLFWHGELQSLCKACHDGKKQRQERRAERAHPGGPPDPGGTSKV